MKATKFVIILVFILSFCIMVLSCSSTRTHATETFKNQVAVIVYHHIADGEGPVQVTSKLFRDQLAYLKAKGFHFISYSQFKQFLAGGSIPSNAVLVTFDDGYESFYQEAYPILKEMAIPAMNFVITKNLENPTADALHSLSRSEITEMVQGGGGQYSFQSHTDSLHRKQENNPFLTTRLTLNGKQESEKEYEQRLLTDSMVCIHKLAELATEPIDAIAYPFGSYNDTAVHLLQQTGIKIGFTVQPGLVEKDTDPMKIPRINAGSPWVTPDGLYQSIVHQAVTFEPPFNKLPLRVVVEQLGGTVFNNDDHSVSVFVNNQKWKINHNNEATNIKKPDEKPIHLSSELTLKKRSLYIQLEDLQKLVAKPIRYDNISKRFFLDAGEEVE
jgi:peptidoglycan/xylan/chitin deacetylase (PgdA/CDA1 family)